MTEPWDTQQMNRESKLEAQIMWLKAQNADLEAKLERVGELPKSWMPVLTSNENGQITAIRRVLTPGQCAIELQAALKEERT